MEEWGCIVNEGGSTGPSRNAPEGIWVRGGGIEIPCRYKLYGLMKYKIKLKLM